MYVKSNLESSITDLSQYCTEKVTEVCAVQIKICNHIILLCIYNLLVGILRCGIPIVC